MATGREFVKDGVEILKAGGKPLFYQAKQVPSHLQELIFACQQGHLDVVRHLWNPAWLPELDRLTREDTCHPLLVATHHLRPGVVEFLCAQGLSPFRPGTVHPYTGDGMVVTELQGISPMALIEKMSFLHPRKSKRRLLIDEVREVLTKAVTTLQPFHLTRDADDPEQQRYSHVPAPAPAAEPYDSEGDDETEFGGVAHAPAGRPSRVEIEGSYDREEDSGSDEPSDDSDSSCDAEFELADAKFSTPITARREGPLKVAEPRSPHKQPEPLKKRKTDEDEAALLATAPVVQPQPPRSRSSSPKLVAHEQAVVMPPPPIARPKQLQFSTPTGHRASPGRTSTPKYVPPVPLMRPAQDPHPVVDSSEDEDIRPPPPKAKPLPPTVVTMFTRPGASVATSPSLTVSTSPVGLPSVPADFAVPGNAMLCSVNVPALVSVPQLLLRILQTVTEQATACDFDDVYNCVNSAMNSTPASLPAPGRSWSAVLPLIPLVLTNPTVRSRRDFSVRHVHVSSASAATSVLGSSPQRGTGTFVANFKLVDVEAGLRSAAPASGALPLDSGKPCQVLFVSFESCNGASGVPSEDGGGFAICLRGQNSVYRWAYQLAGIGLKTCTSDLRSVCPPFLPWEHAVAMHVDSLLTSHSIIPTGDVVLPSLPTRDSYRPGGRVLHVARPSAVAALSALDPAPDTDLESVPQLLNASRQLIMTRSTCDPFDRVVMWLDCRRFAVLENKALHGFVRRHLVAICGSVPVGSSAVVTAVVRCARPSAKDASLSALATVATHTASQCSDLFFSLLDGTTVKAVPSAPAPAVVPAVAEEREFTFTCTFSLVA